MHISDTKTSGFHSGEEGMHNFLHIPSRGNPTSAFLSPHAARLLQRSSPLLAVGVLDDDEDGGWPWCTLLCAHPRDGSSEPEAMVELLGGSMIGVNACIQASEAEGDSQEPVDPVLAILKERFGQKIEANEPRRPETESELKSRRCLIAGLGIDPQKRDRVKISGHIVGGGVVKGESGNVEESKKQSWWEVRLGVLVTSSLGNCPKYIQKCLITPIIPRPIRETNFANGLSPQALALISHADTFFVCSSHKNIGLGVNHRGGSPGFVRPVFSSSSDRKTAATLVWPEFSGNRLYQTLGNLMVTPKAGLVFPDMETGDALYITGHTEIISGKDATALIPRAKLAVKLHIHRATFGKNVLAFRGVMGERSPYNPAVWYLKEEANARAAFIREEETSPRTNVTLISREPLTTDIARFRFKIDPVPMKQWQAGQYVALDFSAELDNGYSHMNEDDPRSLNDDLIRSFTVSSPSPISLDKESADFGADLPRASDEFDITIRNVGKVTGFLFRHNIRAGLEVSLKGFGGTFNVRQSRQEMGREGSITPFIAGGIGITPLLACVPELDLSRLRLYWLVHHRDLGLVTDTFRRFPGLAGCTRLFISGSTTENSSEEMRSLEGFQLKKLTKARLTVGDLHVDDPELEQRWYICTAPSLRKAILDYLGDREAVYEDFDF